MVPVEQRLVDRLAGCEVVDVVLAVPLFRCFKAMYFEVPGCRTSADVVVAEVLRTATWGRGVLENLLMLAIPVNRVAGTRERTRGCRAMAAPLRGSSASAVGRATSRHIGCLKAHAGGIMLTPRSAVAAGQLGHMVEAGVVL